MFQPSQTTKVKRKYKVYAAADDFDERNGMLFISEGSGFKSGDVRLVGGSLNWEGRVEIYLNREWGTISSDGADNLNAHVVCRQLGYDTRC